MTTTPTPAPTPDRLIQMSRDWVESPPMDARVYVLGARNLIEDLADALEASTKREAEVAVDRDNLRDAYNQKAAQAALPKVKPEESVEAGKQVGAQKGEPNRQELEARTAEKPEPMMRGAQALRPNGEPQDPSREVPAVIGGAPTLSSDLADLADLRAEVARYRAARVELEALATLWMEQQAAYPIYEDPKALGAAAAVRCCVIELRAALSQPSPEQFICTHCGWSGTGPRYIRKDQRLCPRCPYMVSMVAPSPEET